VEKDEVLENTQVQNQNSDKGESKTDVNAAKNNINGSNSRRHCSAIYSA